MVATDDPKAMEQNLKCSKRLTKILDSNPQVKFMLNSLETLKCALPSILCSQCPNDRAGGFDPKTNSVLLNQSTITMTLADSLNHELVHAYDNCTTKLDWTNINHVACTEIRANTLSGECRLTREFLKGYTGFSKHFQDCIKRRAIIGVSSSGWDEKDAQIAVTNVWSACFNDFAPFDEIY
jgi:inner membrane protease ATP23